VFQTKNYLAAQKSPFVQHIIAQRKNKPGQKVPAPPKAWASGNVDIRVLRPENQSQTVVTPLIAGLATGLFRESLHVLSSRKPSTPGAKANRTAYKMLVKWLRIYLTYSGCVEFNARDCISGTEFYHRSRVNHIIYSVCMCHSCKKQC
jgi:hypothetical protein